MAITLKQEPGAAHSIYKEDFYTYTSDNLTLSYFKYTLQDLDGVFFTGNTVPLEGNLTYNNPNEILKNKTSFNFNPTIKLISLVPDNCVVYAERIGEEDSTNVFSTRVKNAFRSSNPDMIFSEYVINPYHPDGKFLTNLKTRKVNLHDEVTLKCFNSFFGEIRNDEVGDIFKYGILIKTDVHDVFLTSESNPYNLAPASQEYEPTINGDYLMIEIPAGLENFYGKEFDQAGVLPNGGSWIYFEPNDGLTVKFINGSDITFFDGKVNVTAKILSYEIFALSAKTNFVIEDCISEKIKFELIETCKFDPVNVAWENTLGGVDYMSFTKANEKSIKSDKTVFDFTSNSLNTVSEKIEPNEFNKESRILGNEVTTYLMAQTDWLSQSEIDGLEDLFHSTEVYLKYNNKWISVISTEKKSVIYNKKRKGLKKYTLNFEFSQKNNR
jgi:hypothetical protein